MDRLRALLSEGRMAQATAAEEGDEGRGRATRLRRSEV